MEDAVHHFDPNVPERGRRRHWTELVHRPDGRWEVLCSECLHSREEATPVGIGVPIVNRLEAEGIAHNHALRAVSA